MTPEEKALWREQRIATLQSEIADMEAVIDGCEPGSQAHEYHYTRLLPHLEVKRDLLYLYQNQQ